MERFLPLLLLIGLIAFAAGCGEDDGEATSAAATEEEAAMQ